MFYDLDPWAEIPHLFRETSTAPPTPPPPTTSPRRLNPTEPLEILEPLEVVEPWERTEELEVPDFLRPSPAAQPLPPEEEPLRTVLGGVLGWRLWKRCKQEWSAGHCAELARLARGMDGLAPAATTSIKSTAGASLRWLGMTRERDQLADEVAAAIGQPDDVSESNAARTVRLYGAALCSALGLTLRRCSCYRDLQRDVSPELIELGLAGLREPLI